MRLSTCASCGQQVYYENVSCTRCGAILGFSPELMAIQSFKPAQGELLAPVQERTPTQLYRRCRNWREHNVCNWVLPQSDESDFCVACRLNRTIPNLSEPGNRDLWSAVETAKRRLLYSLLALHLPVAASNQHHQQLTFDFLADSEPAFNETGRVFTGHAEGLITLNIKEADPLIREKMRLNMAEPYRTLLGHFRHESGHYYWDLLVRDSHWLEPVRALFGDDSLDYAQAQTQHYENGAPSDWQARHISAYATMHPWEDWAETWAHYLHIVDTLETAYEFGLRVQPERADDESLQAEISFNPYQNHPFSNVIEHWLPLSYALNSLSRSMGQRNLYPFVLAEPVVQKLSLINRIIHNRVDD